NMMTTAENSSSNAADNADNSDNMSTANSNTHVNVTDNNSHDYLSFDMCLVLNYTNNQLIYYYISDAILTAEQAHFQQLIKQCKTSLELIRWNGMSDNDSNEPGIFEESVTSVIENSDSDCPAPLSDHKGIKIN